MAMIQDDNEWRSNGGNAMRVSGSNGLAWMTSKERDQVKDNLA
jgi:hypothetical protein